MLVNTILDRTFITKMERIRKVRALSRVYIKVDTDSPHAYTFHRGIVE